MVVYDDDQRPRPFYEIRIEDEPPLIGPGYVPPVEVRTEIRDILRRRPNYDPERISSLLRRNHSRQVSADTIRHVLANRRILLDNLP